MHAAAPAGGGPSRSNQLYRSQSWRKFSGLTATARALMTGRLTTRLDHDEDVTPPPPSPSTRTGRRHTRLHRDSHHATTISSPLRRTRHLRRGIIGFSCDCVRTRHAESHEKHASKRNFHRVSVQHSTPSSLPSLGGAFVNRQHRLALCNPYAVVSRNHTHQYR